MEKLDFLSCNQARLEFRFISVRHLLVHFLKFIASQTKSLYSPETLTYYVIKATKSKIQSHNHAHRPVTTVSVCHYPEL